MIPESLWVNSVLAIGSFMFALVLILFFIRIEGKNKEIKLNPKKIIASIRKYSVIFGVILIIVGAIFLIPILFGFENIFLVEQRISQHLTKPPSGLIPNGYFWESKVPPYILELNSFYFNIRFFGFLLSGFLLSLIGVLIIFPSILAHQKNYLEIKKPQLNSKKSIIFILIAIFFLFLFGYLVYLNYLDFEWTFNDWNFGGFDFFSSLEDGAYLISPDGVFFISLLLAIIAFIPLFIFKIGFLDNSSNDFKTIIEDNHQNIKEKKNYSSRFIIFVKSGFIVIKNYMLPVGFILLILGGCFMVLPSRFLIDSYPDFLLETGNVFIENYYGLIRGQMLLIGIPVLILGLSLIIRYILEANRKEPKQRPNKILAFIFKFSTVFGTSFVIVGLLFLATTLIPYGTNLFWFDWYIKNYFWYWYVRVSLFFAGFIFLVIGLFLINRYIRHKRKNR